MNPNPDEIPLDEQVRCVKREISKRNYVYPYQVQQGKMTREKAEREIAVMQAVLATLEKLAADQNIDLKAKGNQLKLI